MFLSGFYWLEVFSLFRPSYCFSGSPVAIYVTKTSDRRTLGSAPSLTRFRARTGESLGADGCGFVKEGVLSKTNLET